MKIQLSPMQKKLHEMTRLATVQAQHELSQIDSQIKKLQERGQAIAKSAGDNESDMLALIGADHGVKVPTNAQILNEEKERFFVWEEETEEEKAD